MSPLFVMGCNQSRACDIAKSQDFPLDKSQYGPRTTDSVPERSVAPLTVNVPTTPPRTARYEYVIGTPPYKPRSIHH